MESILSKIYNKDLGYDSRYRKSRILTYEDGIQCLETQEPIDLPIDDTDKFYEVDLSTENRLDIISYKFYGNPLYWWVIAEISNIKDPSVVPRGTILRIPSIDRILLTVGVINE